MVLWLFTNPANQWAAANQTWIGAACVFSYVPVVLWPAGGTVVTLAALGGVFVWLAGLNAATLYWLRRSRRLGLKNLLVRPVPAGLMNHLGRGIGLALAGPVAEVHTWTHVSYRGRGGIDRYQEDLREDAQTLAALVRGGRLKARFVTCNTFNRYLLEALEEAFSDCQADYVEATALSASDLRLYRKKQFAKLQKRMFGRVYSTRDTPCRSEWDLLVIETRGGGDVGSCG